MNRNQQIAETIRAQLGRGALMMLGAKDLLTIENGLQLTIRGSKIANKIRIVLDPSDTYTVSFYRVRAGSCVEVASVPGVYVDSLHKTIETATGLYTSI